MLPRVQLRHDCVLRPASYDIGWATCAMNRRTACGSCASRPASLRPPNPGGRWRSWCRSRARTGTAGPAGCRKSICTATTVRLSASGWCLPRAADAALRPICFKLARKLHCLLEPRVAPTPEISSDTASVSFPFQAQRTRGSRCVTGPSAGIRLTRGLRLFIGGRLRASGPLCGCSRARNM